MGGGEGVLIERGLINFLLLKRGVLFTFSENMKLYSYRTLGIVCNKFLPKGRSVGEQQLPVNDH